MLKKRVLILGVLSACALVGGIIAGPRQAALAAPVVSSGTFSLASLNDVQTIFTSATADVAGVTVSVSTGLAQVEKDSGGSWTTIGAVTAGSSSVFEGVFTSVRVKALVPSTAGTYSNRSPTTANSGPDYVVGAGMVTLGSTPIRFYAQSTALSRHVFVTAGASSVSLRTSSSGSNLITVPAGRWGVYHGLATEFWLSGGGSVQFTVLENPTAGTWMLLPKSHWLDPFTAMHTDGRGNVWEGTLDEDSDDVEPTISFTYHDPDTEEDVECLAVANQALVSFVPAASQEDIEDLFDEAGLDILGCWYEPNASDASLHVSLFHVEIQAESTFEDDVPGLIEYLEGLSIVEYAEYNGIWERGASPQEFPIPPIDFYYDDYQGDQRALNIEDGYERINGETWISGIAVFDTGVDMYHPELINQLYEDPNSGERQAVVIGKGQPKVGNPDEDENLRKIKPEPGDRDWHGTAMAGVAAAEVNGPPVEGQSYTAGLAGVGLNVQFLPVALKSTWGALVKAARAMNNHFPKENFGNLRVVSVSIYGKAPSKSLDDAIYADIVRNDRLYVSIAGNKFKSGKYFPAAYGTKTKNSVTVEDIVLGVTGAFVNTSGSVRRDPESNYWDPAGTGALDKKIYGVSAMSVLIPSTDIRGSEEGHNSLGSDYVLTSGTSFAAPQVSALAAMLFGLNPNWTSTDVSRTITFYAGSAISFTDNNNNTRRIPGIANFDAALNATSPATQQ